MFRRNTTSFIAIKRKSDNVNLYLTFYKKNNNYKNRIFFEDLLRYKYVII